MCLHVLHWVSLRDHGGGGGRHDVAANRQEDQEMIQEEAQEAMEAVGLDNGTT